MDARLLRLYEEELRYLREIGGEFAREYPKIAGRLGLDGFECADPYVERLLEGVAFLTARVQLKLDEQFPELSRSLLELIHPPLARPVPSMVVAELAPDLAEGALAEGYTVPRGSVLRSVLAKGDRTACEYRTAHDITLWPLRVTDTRYLASAGAVAAAGLPVRRGVKAALQLQLEVTAGLGVADLALDRLPVFLHGSDEIPMNLYEQVLGNGLGCYVRGDPGNDAPLWLSRENLRQVGFEREEALLPPSRRSFDGYRLLQEYFAFPARFLFFEITGLQQALRRLSGSRLELTICLERGDTRVEHALQPKQFRLFAVPAVNLFPLTADRIHVDPAQPEFHVVPDRNRPMDFEVYAVEGVTGFGRSPEDRREFHPFYQLTHHRPAREGTAFFSVQRRPRQFSARQRREGARSSYLGSECFLSIVDTDNAPFAEDLRQLEVRTLCSNRDLPLQMPLGKGATDFTMESAAPVSSLRVLAGPTRPRGAFQAGDTVWRLISQLSLNYLSLMDQDAETGAAALREMLALYVDSRDALARHVEGVRSVSSRAAVRRMPVSGPICFGNGLEVRLRFDEAAFTGVGSFLLGAVLERFFAKYVSINSFTQTVVELEDRGEVMRWPVRTGQRLTL
ncbi:type VI secretion system baseplate subunit TssF [Sediminicurvatus halobius]|uniref:Type VI secretion system baseplate subunit TssF n=1 Tax=Sediminicurvatus halobius TaxID=2182432 RepID=A0A2U2N2Q5_9GAMM|nr:type VI secretion system baseplate subunit TssF [Spiribacter halobius]PWG63264.1 type VI secretion system baseplate subunit TssF [Spiribacter halobius]UEX76663.1 type VI secretion system baseplate subunit TssF [Spiribacter halobius]